MPSSLSSLSVQKEHIALTRNSGKIISILVLMLQPSSYAIFFIGNTQ